MMIPPMKVTQRAAPQAVEKQRRWVSLTKVVIFDDFDSNVSGENKTPIARNVTAPRNRVIHAIMIVCFELIEFQELGVFELVKGV